MNIFAQTEVDYDIITKEDKTLINSIKTSFSRKNWDFDDTEIRKFKNKIGELKNLYFVFENKSPNRDGVLIAFYIGFLEYLYFENYDEASKYLTKAYENRNLLENNSAEMSLFTSLGDLEKAQNNYNNSIYFYTKGLDFALKTGNYLEQYRIYRELGTNYREIGIYDLAFRNLSNANKLINRAQLTKQDVVWMNIHLGRLYRLTKKYDLAEEQYKKALKSDIYRESPRIKPFALEEYIIFWHDIKKPDSVIKYSNQIIDLVINNNQNSNSIEKYSRSVLPTAYIYRGEIANAKNNKIEAEQNYKLAFHIGKQINMVNKTRIAAKWLFQNATDDILKANALQYLENSYDSQNNTVLATFSEENNMVKAMRSDLFSEIKAAKKRFIKYNIILTFILILFVFIFLYLRNILEKKLLKIKQYIKEKKISNIKSQAQIELLENNLKSNHSTLHFIIEKTSQTLLYNNRVKLTEKSEEIEKKLKIIKFMLQKEYNLFFKNKKTEIEKINLLELFQKIIENKTDTNLVDKNKIKNNIPPNLVTLNYSFLVEETINNFITKIFAILNLNEISSITLNANENNNNIAIDFTLNTTCFKPINVTSLKHIAAKNIYNNTNFSKISIKFNRQYLLFYRLKSAFGRNKRGVYHFTFYFAKNNN